MDGMPLNTIVSVFLGVVIAGMINTIYIKENTRFLYIVFKGKNVRSNNFKIPRDSIVGVNITYKKKNLLLVRNKRIDLFTYKCEKGLAVKYSFGHSNDKFFEKYTYIPKDFLCGDESFTFFKNFLKGIY